MIKVIIINGLPGSGKGTQASLLAKELDYAHVSSGQLIREAISSGKEDKFTAGLVERYEKGIVQPDDVANRLVFERLLGLRDAKGIIFDSFPISLGQSKFLEERSRELNLAKPVFIHLKVDPESVVQRLKTRKICSSCGQPVIDKNDSLQICQKCGGKLTRRSDDDPATVRTRIDNYRPLLLRQIEYYRNKGKIVEINGNGSIEEVFRRIKRGLA